MMFVRSYTIPLQVNVLVAAFLFMISSSAFSQEPTLHRLKYAINNKSVPLPKGAQLKIIVGSDTISAVKKGKKYKLPVIESDFTILVSVDNIEFIYGPLQPQTINDNNEIIFMRLRDIKNMKQSAENPTVYYYNGNQYTMDLKDPELIEEIRFLMFVQNNKRMVRGRFMTDRFGVSKIIYRK